MRQMRWHRFCWDLNFKRYIVISMVAHSYFLNAICERWYDRYAEQQYGQHGHQDELEFQHW